MAAFSAGQLGALVGYIQRSFNAEHYRVLKFGRE
jgi:hypothetical protein